MRRLVTFAAGGLGVTLALVLLPGTAPAAVGSGQERGNRVAVADRLSAPLKGGALVPQQRSTVVGSAAPAGKWIDSAWWVHVSPYGWSLHVRPTWLTRTGGGSDAAGYATGSIAWNELYDLYHNAGLCCNLSGMRDQFICHVMFVPFKDTYDIEEWRPDAGFPATVTAKCNPGVPSSD
jgi:hypothetical protein